MIADVGKMALIGVLAVLRLVVVGTRAVFRGGGLA